MTELVCYSPGFKQRQVGGPPVRPRGVPLARAAHVRRGPAAVPLPAGQAAQDQARPHRALRALRGRRRARQRLHRAQRPRAAEKALREAGQGEWLRNGITLESLL